VGKSLAPAVQFPLRSSDLAFPVNLTARNDLETVRYYKRRSLQPKPPRSASGYRLFPIEATQVFKAGLEAVSPWKGHF
jgi:hypothetical protein